MRIDVALTPDEVGHAGPAAAAAVIDVVRASTTIVTALAHGAVAVVPVASPEEAWARAAAWPPGRVLVGGERGGRPLQGFEAGNSPVEYTRERVAGRVVVFTTTNGTRALLAVRGYPAVAVAGYVNAAAVAVWLARRGPDVLLVCAGESGRFCLEDAAAAGLLVARLALGCRRARLTDGARAALAIHRRYAGDPDRVLRRAAWARALRARGQGADLRCCAALDRFDVVPVLRDGALRAAGPD